MKKNFRKVLIKRHEGVSFQGPRWRQRPLDRPENGRQTPFGEAPEVVLSSSLPTKAKTWIIGILNQLFSKVLINGSYARV